MRGFSSEYVVHIQKYFVKSIEKKRGASFGDGRKFLAEFPSDKTPKQVQGKVKNLIKTTKRVTKNVTCFEKTRQMAVVSY